MDSNPANKPTWASNYKEFQTHIQLQFGIPKAATNAAIQLDTLCMRNGQKFLEFIVEFQCYAALTKFNKEALVFQLWKAIPQQLWNDIATIPKGMPKHLSYFKAQLQQFDSNYWAHVLHQQHLGSHLQLALQPQPQQTTVASTTTMTLTAQTQMALLATLNTPQTTPNVPQVCYNYNSTVITQEEYNQHCWDNACYWCRGAGHIGANCPLYKAVVAGHCILAKAHKAAAKLAKDAKDKTNSTNATLAP
jgi:hypothetical protein